MKTHDEHEEIHEDVRGHLSEIHQPVNREKGESSATSNARGVQNLDASLDDLLREEAQLMQRANPGYPIFSRLHALCDREFTAARWLKETSDPEPMIVAACLRVLQYFGVPARRERVEVFAANRIAFDFYKEHGDWLRGDDPLAKLIAQNGYRVVHIDAACHMAIRCGGFFFDPTVRLYASPLHEMHPLMGWIPPESNAAFGVLPFELPDQSLVFYKLTDNNKPTGRGNPITSRRLAGRFIREIRSNSAI